MDGKTVDKRNGSLDLIKFLLAVSLVLFHGRAITDSFSGVGYMTRGASAVEGFFIIAGFFMARTAINKQIDSVSYIWKRYKQVFPQHVFAFIFAFMVACTRNSFTLFSNLKDIIKLAIRSIPEFLLFPPIAGLKYSLAKINGIEWFLSAMLIGMALIYPLLKRYKRNYCLFIGPLVFLFLSGYLYQTLGTYRGTYDMTGFFCNGLIRAVADMSLGTFAYGVLEETKPRIKGTTKNKVLVTVLGILCWGATFYYLNSTLPTAYEFAIIYFTGAGVFFSSLGLSYFYNPLSNSFVKYLGKLSLPMFLNQGWIRKILIDHRFGEKYNYGQNLLVFFMIVIVVSIICVLVTDRVMKWIHSR